MSHDQTTAAASTDRELWREREGDYYAPSVFVTQSGGIGMNVGGNVIVKPLRDWHKLAWPNPRTADMSIETDHDPASEAAIPRTADMDLIERLRKVVRFSYADIDAVREAVCLYDKERAEAASEIARLRSGIKGWRCFLCDEVFTSRDKAQDHFGYTPMDPPACLADQTELALVRKERDRLRNEVEGARARGFENGVEMAARRLEALLDESKRLMWTPLLSHQMIAAIRSLTPLSRDGSTKEPPK